MQMADVQYHREGERGKTLGFFDRQRALEFRSWLCKRKREREGERERRPDRSGRRPEIHRFRCRKAWCLQARKIGISMHRLARRI